MSKQVRFHGLSSAASIWSSVIGGASSEVEKRGNAARSSIRGVGCIPVTRQTVDRAGMLRCHPEVRAYRFTPPPASAAIRWAVAASGSVESIFSAWFNCAVPREPSPDLK